MTDDYEPDPLRLSLARLQAPTPRPEREQRVKVRCHAALAQQAARTRERRATLVARAADVVLTAVLCGYAAITVVEAFRLIH